MKKLFLYNFSCYPSLAAFEFPDHKKPLNVFFSILTLKQTAEIEEDSKVVSNPLMDVKKDTLTLQT